MEIHSVKKEAVVTASFIYITNSRYYLEFPIKNKAIVPAEWDPMVGQI